MKLLLDTHTLLWFLREPERLPPRVLEAIEAAGSEAGVSLASLWEIAIKASQNKLYLPKMSGPYPTQNPGAIAIPSRTGPGGLTASFRPGRSEPREAASASVVPQGAAATPTTTTLAFFKEEPSHPNKPGGRGRRPSEPRHEHSGSRSRT